ncbi:MAG: prepilin-type N-terminal cleavage/methylation domain-containing protein, partial [Patescibacteria group bacterium]
FFMSRNSRRGFTKIELLVVLAIIGLLVSLILVSLGSIKARSRDVRRVVDIDVFIKALNLYNNSFSVYPIYDGYITGEDPLSDALRNSSVLSSIPLDPTNKQVGSIIYKYDYFSDGTNFQIQYCMETDSVPNTNQGCGNYARP